MEEEEEEIQCDAQFARFFVWAQTMRTSEHDGAASSMGQARYITPLLPSYAFLSITSKH